MIKLSLKLLTEFINNVLKCCLVELSKNIGKEWAFLGVEFEKLKILTKPFCKIWIVGNELQFRILIARIGQLIESLPSSTI